MDNQSHPSPNYQNLLRLEVFDDGVMAITMNVLITAEQCDEVLASMSKARDEIARTRDYLRKPTDA